MHEPVVRIEINGPWFVGRKGVFKVESFEGMEWSAKDYVALYKVIKIGNYLRTCT